MADNLALRDQLCLGHKLRNYIYVLKDMLKMLKSNGYSTLTYKYVSQYEKFFQFIQ